MSMLATCMNKWCWQYSVCNYLRIKKCNANLWTFKRVMIWVRNTFYLQYIIFPLIYSVRSFKFNTKKAHLRRIMCWQHKVVHGRNNYLKSTSQYSISFTCDLMIVIEIVNLTGNCNFLKSKGRFIQMNGIQGMKIFILYISLITSYLHIPTSRSLYLTFLVY